MIFFSLLACAEPDPYWCTDDLPALLGTIADESGNTNIGATLSWTLADSQAESGECDTPLSVTNCVVWRAGTEPGDYALTANAPGYEEAVQSVTVVLSDADSAVIATGSFQITLVAAADGVP